jgi:hypothetical protein
MFDLHLFIDFSSSVLTFTKSNVNQSIFHLLIIASGLIVISNEPLELGALQSLRTEIWFN